jgi:cell division septal protein FtsQ
MSRVLPKLIFALALLLAGAAVGLRYYPLLTVNSVEIHGTDKIKPGGIGVEPGVNLLRVDVQRVLDSLVSIPFVESATIRCDYRGNLIADVTEKQPVCYLYSDKLHGLSATSELLPLSVPAADLPVIRGVSLRNVSEYDFIDNIGLHAGVKLVNLMSARSPALANRVSEIIVDDGGLRLILEPGTLIADLGWGQYLEKLEMLEIVLTRNLNPALHLDLRLGELAIVKARATNRRSSYGV